YDRRTGWDTWDVLTEQENSGKFEIVGMSNTGFVCNDTPIILESKDVICTINGKIVPISIDECGRINVLQSEYSGTIEIKFHEVPNGNPLPEKFYKGFHLSTPSQP